MEYSEVGNTVIMEKPFFRDLMDRVAEKASRSAIEAFRIEQMKNDDVTVKEAARVLKVSRSTVIRYINEGRKRGGRITRLPARSTGKDYRINRYDLEQFKTDIR